MEQVKEIVRADAQAAELVERLAAVGAPPFAIELPGADDLAPILLDLAVPHEDINPLVALRAELDDSPELWWLLDRCVHALVRQMGEIGDLPTFPLLAEHLGPLGRYFYVYVFVATLPHVRAFHQARGIPDEVSR
jgi:N-acyltransferase N-terminal domain